MLNYSGMEKTQTEKLSYLPNVNSLLKISLGLIFFTIISTALVYAETISVDVEGNSFDVEYTGTGVTVSGIEADLDFISLIISVDVPDSEGALDITFERSFFDSTFEGLDDDFIILVDGDEPTFTETETTSEIRTLSIDLPAGTEEIEIIGSEFGDSVPIAIEEDVDETEDAEEDTTEEDTTEEDAAAKAAADKAAADAAAKAAADKAAADAAADTPKVQCGPGTILKDGACVLDERCGPGTILKDGECVLDSTPTPSQISPKGIGKELLIGVLAAFAVAGAVGIILALMSKASKSRD